jgi:hypothetical protein
MRASHQHVFDWNAGGFARPPLGFVEDFAGNHATVAQHDRETVRAVVEDETPGPEFVVDVRPLPILSPPDGIRRVMLFMAWPAIILPPLGSRETTRQAIIAVTANRIQVFISAPKRTSIQDQIQ